MNDITQELEATQDNVRRFWHTQDRLLDNMEKFAHEWFERRHVGSHAAQEAAQRMCKVQNPVDAQLGGSRHGVQKMKDATELCESDAGGDGGRQPT